MGPRRAPGGPPFGSALTLGLTLALAAMLAIEPGCRTRATVASMDASDAVVSDAAVPDAGDDTPIPDATDDAGVGALPSKCRFDGPANTAHAVLAVAVDGGIVLVMSDGSTLAAYQFISVRPPAGTSFWIRLEPVGADILATATWWGDGDPTSCELRDGSLWCPETDRFVRISPDGEVISEITQHVITSSANIGSAPARDTDAGVPATPVAPALPDPAVGTWVFPAGLIPMSRIIDSQSWFVAVLRDEYRAGVYRSPDAASNWTLLGKTLGQVEQVMVRNVAGTYVIDALGTGSVFVSKQVWQDAPVGQEPELLQNSHQLVRPATGVADVINYGNEIIVNISSDGLCAANWEPTPSGRQLTVYDLTTDGARRALVVEKVGIGYPDSLWIE